MALTITVRSGDKEVPGVTFDSPRVVLGRSAGSDVRLPDPSVSHRHASLRQRGAEYIVLDEGSTNGTFVGQVKLSPGAPRVIKDGDQIRLGRVWIEVGLEQAMPTQNPTQLTREIALGLVAGALEAEGMSAAPKLTVTAGPDDGRETLLTEFGKSYTIGRNKRSSLLLTDDDVSRMHVEVIRRGSDVLVKDPGSKNGASLEGLPLTPHNDTRWKPGQVLAIGKTRITLDDPLHLTMSEIEAAPDETLSAEDVDNALAPEPSPGMHPTQEAKLETQPLPSTELGTSRPSSPPTEPVTRTPRHRSGWGTADVLVALIATVVLGLSVLGLLWLLDN